MTDDNIAVLDFLRPAASVPALSFLSDATLSVPVDLSGVGGEEAYVETEGGLLVPAGVADRVAQCGQLRHKPDWKTGKRVGYYQRCGLHLHCDDCLRRRADAEAARFSEAVGDGDAWRVVVPPGGDAAKVVRGIDSSRYRRYPQEDGSTVIVHTDLDAGGEVVDTSELDWLELARTPEGSNWSGKLSAAPPPAAPAEPVQEEGASKVVRVPEFTVEDPLDRMPAEQREDFTACWELATLATAHLDPDLDTVSLAMAERMRHYRSALESRSYRVRFFVYGYERAREDEIDWKLYNNRIRKKLQGQGYVNVALDGPVSQRHLEFLRKEDPPA